ncbi:carbon-nitrogen hydrolase family protein [Gelria sp. Kuro-4]|uniref:carbon-nitrogen hydrolase family protein n=1 Tax=Gelria sp. Kuro-4 TaxID=2796927 RepID=UPI001BF0D6E8|nr:carbon-nitrogen hydrolase family protein [Gelria sp. Kuro-4]BCV25698.1 putative hydrolase [Gelria sp. Kuro-4]
MKVRLALCQYATELGDKEKNVSLSLEWLERAGKEKPDLVVLPELITTGYAAGEKHLELAEPVPGPVTDKWGAVAQRYGFNLIAGICRRDSELPGVVYNSAVLINRRGEVAGIYSKAVLPLYVHTWTDPAGNPILIEEAEIFRRGDDLPVFKTDIGNIGIEVCQDAVYAEFIRVFAFRGAQLVVQVFNHPSPVTDIEHDILKDVTRVHAWENGVFVIAANKCGTERFEYRGIPMEATFQGESHVADPFGRLVAIGKIQEPDLVVAEIDTDLVRQAQWGAKFIRDFRPELLTPLTKMGVSLGDKR